MPDYLLNYWRQRGIDDARRGRPSCFRNTRVRGIEFKGERPDHWDNADIEQAYLVYCDGFDNTEEE